MIVCYTGVKNIAGEKPSSDVALE